MLKKTIAVAAGSAMLFSAGVVAGVSTQFSDVESGSWYEAAANWSADAGIMTGRTGGQFAPGASVTRAELAVALQRYDKYITEKHMMDMEMDVAMEEGDEMDEGMEATSMDMMFDVTVKNVSKTQALAPGVYALHTGDVSLDFEGKLSPKELEPLAEYGSPAMFADYLKGMDGIIAVYTVDEPIGPGKDVVFKVTAPAGMSDVHLSGMQMVVGTNDGYALTNSINLFTQEGMPEVSTVVPAMNYDNGTEENSGLLSGFVGGQPDSSKGEANVENGKTTNPQEQVSVHFELTETVAEVMVKYVPVAMDSEESETSEASDVQ